MAITRFWEYNKERQCLSDWKVVLKVIDALVDLVSGITSRCLLMVMWPNLTRWCDLVQLVFCTEHKVGSFVRQSGFLKQLLQVVNLLHLMTTIVSIASVRWLAVVEFSLGRIKSVCVHPVWTSHKLQFILKLLFNLLASMSAVRFGLAIWFNFFWFKLLWATLSYGYLASKALYWGSLFMTILHSTVRLLEGFSLMVDSSSRKSIGNYDCNSVVQMK